MSKVIRIETEKVPTEVILEIEKKAADFDFIIRNVFDMMTEFRDHGVEIENEFEYYSVMLCNPKKAYKSILESPIRGAVLFPPKQIVVFKEKDKTIISYVAVEEKDVKELLPEDKSFQKGLSESCNNIIKLIDEII